MAVPLVGEILALGDSVARPGLEHALGVATAMEVSVCEGKVLATRLQRKLKEVRRGIFFSVDIMPCFELPEYGVVLVPRPEVRALYSH